MKTWSEWHQEERDLLEKEDQNWQKRQNLQDLQETYAFHFQQGLRFVEEIHWRFRNHERESLHQQVLDRVSFLAKSIQNQLDETGEKLQLEKRNLEDELNIIAYEKRKASLAEGGAKG